jgi:ubiquinone/menaquinone biosynthesis C-methylase UbiE
MTDTAQFWDKISRKYSRSPIKDQESYDQTMDRTRSYLSLEDRILEVGCGTGSTALLLAPSVGHVVATDFSPGMIDIANEKRVAGNVENVEFQVADAAANVAPQQPYDAVLTFNLLHLLRDPAETLRALSGELKPGGLLISKSVCLKGGWGVLPILIKVMQMIGKAPYVNIFSVSELEAIVENAGFKIIETGTFPLKPPSRFIVAQKQ